MTLLNDKPELSSQLLTDLLVKEKTYNPLQTALKKIIIHNFMKSTIKATNSPQMQGVLEEAGIDYLKLKGSCAYGVSTWRSPSDIDFEVVHSHSDALPDVTSGIKMLMSDAEKGSGYETYYLPVELLSLDLDDQAAYKLLGRESFYIKNVFLPEEVLACIANPQPYSLNTKDIETLKAAIRDREPLEAVVGLDLTSNNYAPIITPSRELTAPGTGVTIKALEPYDTVVNKLRMTAEGVQKETSLAKVLFDIYIFSNPDSAPLPDHQLSVRAEDSIDPNDPLLKKLLFFSLFDVPYTEGNFANINIAYLNPDNSETVDRVLRGLEKLDGQGLILTPGQEINRAFAHKILEHTWNIFRNATGIEIRPSSDDAGQTVSAFTSFTEDEQRLTDAVHYFYEDRSRYISLEDVYERIYPLALKVAPDMGGRESVESFADRMARRIQKSIGFFATYEPASSHNFAIWVKSPGTSSHLKTAMLLADELEARDINVTIVTDSDARQRAERLGYGDRDFVVLPHVPSLPEDGGTLDAEVIKARQAALSEGARILKEERRKRHWDGFATELWPTAMSSHNEQLIGFFDDAYNDEEHPMLTYCIGRDIPGQNKSGDASQILSQYMTRLLQGNDINLRRITRDLPGTAAMEAKGRIEYVGFYGAKATERVDLPEDEKEILVQAGASFKEMNEELYISALDMYSHLPDDLPPKTMRLVIDRASNPEAFMRIVAHAIDTFEPGMAAFERNAILRGCIGGPDETIALNKEKIILQGLIPSREYSEIMGRAAVIYTRGGLNALEGAKSNIGVVGFPCKPFWLRHQETEQEKRLKMLRDYRIDGEPLVEIVRKDDVLHHPKAIAGAITQAYASAQLRKEFLKGQPAPILFDGFVNAEDVIVADLQALSRRQVVRAAAPGHYVYAPRLLSPPPQIARRQHGKLYSPAP